MQTANEILKFSSPLPKGDAAKNFSLIQVTKLIEERIEILNDITDKVGKRTFKFMGTALIPEIFQKFKNGIKSGKVPDFEKKDLRTLTYTLSFPGQFLPSIYSQQNELDIALKMLASNWKDSYLIGLFDCYLKSWGMGNQACFMILHKFVSRQLAQFTGERKDIKSFKVNAKFYDPINGDVLLGSELALKRIPLNQATKYLSLPDTWFTYSYFSKVILAFYERNKQYLDNLLPEIENALLLHCSNSKGSATSKSVISKIIIQCSDAKFEHLQDAVKDMALKLIGDPVVISNWSIDPNLSDAEKVEQRRAKDILNIWITSKFIAVFFDRCINDPRRKKYWLKAAKHISDFKVFGPENVRKDLINIKSISKLVDSRFKATTSTKQVSAFLMIIGDFKLIEFSDPGYAFYTYRKSNESAPSFDRKYQSVDNFRNSSMPYLVETKGGYWFFSDEGRLSHRKDDWEGVFSAWIRNKIGIHV